MVHGLAQIKLVLFPAVASTLADEISVTLEHGGKTSRADNFHGKRLEGGEGDGEFAEECQRFRLSARRGTPEHPVRPFCVVQQVQ